MEMLPEDIVARMERYARGEATWAEVEGFTAREARRAAEQACELARTGRLEQARTLLEGLVALNPKDAAAQAALGTVYEKLGCHDAARGAYDEALRKDPHHPVALANRGELRLRLGDAGGYADLLGAIAADPAGATAAAKRAQAIAKALALAAASQARPVPRS